MAVVNSMGDRVEWSRAVPYLLFNLAAVVLAVVYPPHAIDLLLFLALYGARIFFVGGVLHRYFAHRSYATSRAFQFVLGVLACVPLLYWRSGKHGTGQSRESTARLRPALTKAYRTAGDRPTRRRRWPLSSLRCRQRLTTTGECRWRRALSD